MGIIIHWIVLAVIFLGLACFVPGMRVTSFWNAFLAVIVLSLVNIFIAPILLFLSLPANILTFGLFTLVINALMVWLVSAIVPGFEIDGFGAAFVVALCMTVVSTVLL